MDIVLAGAHPRRVYEMSRGMLFGGKSAKKFEPPGFDGSKWEKITLPHANVRLPWHSFDEQDFQFVSAYCRHFKALPAWKRRSLPGGLQCERRCYMFVT